MTFHPGSSGATRLSIQSPRCSRTRPAWQLSHSPSASMALPIMSGLSAPPILTLPATLCWQCVNGSSNPLEKTESRCHAQSSWLCHSEADLVRTIQMNSRTLLAVLALLVIGTTASAQNFTRTLMYTFQDGNTLLSVGFIDTRPSARGFVLCPSAPRRQKGFQLSTQQFEQAWRAFESSGARKFGGPATREFDAVRNYVFSVVDVRHGGQTNCVVPKNRASAALVSLARQFEAYAR